MLFILFLLIPLLANAEWVRYSQSQKQGFVAFYSPTSIHNEGEFKVVTILKNYVKPKQFTAEKPYFKYYSAVETHVVDCGKNIYRNKRIELWTQAWAKGKLGRAYDYVDEKHKDNWGEPIKSTSVQAVVMDIVCVGV